MLEKIRKYRNWYLVPLMFIVIFVLIMLGQILGMLLMNLVPIKNSDAWETGSMYLSFIGIWIVFLIYLYTNKRYKKYLVELTPAKKGNTIGYLLFGLFLGFVLNALCILVARLNQDIKLTFDQFEILTALFLLFTVFVQSSAEELVCRGFLFPLFLDTYKKPWFAMILNAGLFALLHIFNPGMTFLAFLNLLLSGIFFSFLVYYCDSLWGAMAAHTGWNYTQSILFGLPNSGGVVPYSIFKLDTASAKNSFAYNVGFGVEATVVAAIVLTLAIAAIYLLKGKTKEV